MPMVPQVHQGIRQGHQIETKAQRERLQNVEAKWQQAAEVINTQLTHDAARQEWQAQFQRIEDAVVAGTEIPVHENFWTRKDIEEDYDLRRPAIRRGMERLVASIADDIFDIEKRYRDYINDILIEQEAEERRQAQEWGITFKPSLTIDRYRAVRDHMDTRIKRHANPSWSASPSTLLAGIVDFEGGK
jgi:hypothetical protein